MYVQDCDGERFEAHLAPATDETRAYLITENNFAIGPANARAWGYRIFPHDVGQSAALMDAGYSKDIVAAPLFV